MSVREVCDAHRGGDARPLRQHYLQQINRVPLRVHCPSYNETRSGTGSTFEATWGIRSVMPHLINLLKINSIADIPCGDFNYMRRITKSKAFFNPREPLTLVMSWSTHWSTR
eukprot:3287964-Prymnesium_polylepis.1